jgi:hypothetical protein
VEVYCGARVGVGVAEIPLQAVNINIPMIKMGETFLQRIITPLHSPEKNTGGIIKYSEFIIP